MLQVPVAAVEDTAPEIPARAFRVVCDSMLQGLARSLRLLGADVLALGNSEDHRRAAEVSGKAPRGPRSRVPFSGSCVLCPIPQALLGAQLLRGRPPGPGHCAPAAPPAAVADSPGPGLRASFTHVSPLSPVPASSGPIPTAPASQLLSRWAAGKRLPSQRWEPSHPSNLPSGASPTKLQGADGHFV